MADIVILGGGLAGISAAYHLEQKGFFAYSLFEKENQIGGLCGSIKQDGFTFDYTGHLLHINDSYFQNLIDKVIGFDNFNVINRRSFIYSQNRYTRYPYQINLHGLPTKTIADCIEGYIKRHTNIKKPKHFKAWVLKQFGAGFAKHFFLPYQKKIFAYDLEKITESWTGRFVPSTSLEQIISGAVAQRDKPIGYNAQFFYPKRGGIFFWVDKLAQQLHNPIYSSCKVIKIDLKEKLVLFENGHIEHYKMLINTMPLDQLLKMMTGNTSRSFSTAADKLICNSVLNFNLGVGHDQLSDKHWIYFPESNYPFYRIGFAHNFSSQMAPDGCSSLYGEIAYINQTDRYKRTILTKALKKTKQLLGIQENDVVTKKIIDISHAYVIYDHWRERQLPKLLASLEQADIYSIGRYGAWKYCSMQETLLDGKQLADRLLIKPATIWQIKVPNKHKEIEL